MEIQIYNPQDDGFIRKIEWNFEQLKTEISAAADSYATSVYTDDTMKHARADRAKLNKFAAALTGKRTEIRKKLLEPDESFGQEVKELVSIIQRAIDNIDDQIKGYEERQRAEKEKKIREFYEEHIHDIGAFLPFERVMKPEYANASVTMKSIKGEILALIQKVDEGLAILNEVDSPYAGDMKEVFLRTYDIGASLAEQNRLEAAERRRREYEEERLRQKAEREAREKAEADRVMQAGRRPETASAGPADEPAQTLRQTRKETLDTPKEGAVYSIDFRVYATKEQLNQLKSFLKISGIRFEPVPKQ